MSNLTIFAQRLKQVMYERNLTQKQLAELAEVRPATISTYLKNTTEGDSKGKNPSLSVAIEIADKLNVSLDWLCGISDKPTGKGIENAPLRMNEYLELLIYMMKRGGMWVKKDDRTVEDERGHEISISDISLVLEDTVLEEFLIEYKKLCECGEGGTFEKEFVDTYTQALINKFEGYVFDETRWDPGTKWHMG